MELIQTVVNKEIVYLLVHDQNKILSGVLCRCANHVFDYMTKWSIDPNVSIELSKQMVQSGFPHTHTSQPTEFHGFSAMMLAKLFEYADLLSIKDLSIPKFSFNKHTFYFALAEEGVKNIDSVLLCFIDDMEECNLVSIRSREQGQYVLLFPWICGHVRNQLTTTFDRLPKTVLDSQYPVLLQGTLVAKLIKGFFLHNLTFEYEQAN